MKNRASLKKPAKKTPTTSTARKKAAAKRKTPARPAATAIPTILLEGDEAAPVSVSGPGQRYVLGREQVSPVETGGAHLELPEGYGTKRLYLTARDPHWLYAYWDLTRAQQLELNRLSRHQHLIIRVYQDNVAGDPVNEIHVHPESRNWFIHVGRGNASFVAVLGYYGKSRKWTEVSTSTVAKTPPDSVSEDTSFAFETLPAEVGLGEVVALVKRHGQEHRPLLEAIQELRRQGHTDLPPRRAFSSGPWTSHQEQALARLISMDTVRRVWIGSLEITEWLQEQLRRENASLGVSEFGISSLWSGALSSPMGPLGQMAGRRGFWFNVNAELIIYGATEPDARVTIGGRPIRLRPDGTFSFRFALPDGQYQLPARAESADGVEARTASLEFRRQTQYQGEVGHHPQDARLRPPRAENVS